MIQRYTIGRDPNNTVVVQNPTVSGYHGDLIVDDSSGFLQYTYVDHSTNGTVINGQFLRNASCYVIFNDSILLAGNVPFDWGVLPISYQNNQFFYPSQPNAPASRGGEGISFVGALKSFFNNYVNFKGRATRREYWFAYLWMLIFQTGLSLLLFPIALTTIGGALDSYGDIISVLLGMGWYVAIWSLFDLAIFLPSLSILVRRIHDTGKDGLWILMLLVPLANIVFFFIWTLSPSDPRINKWGR